MGRPTRRTVSPQQKLEIVMQLLRGERQLTALAREHGVDHTTIHRRRDRMRAAALEPLAGRRQPADRAAEARIVELQRALSRETLELEILGEASGRLGSAWIHRFSRREPSGMPSPCGFARDPHGSSPCGCAAEPA